MFCDRSNFFLCSQSAKCYAPLKCLWGRRKLPAHLVLVATCSSSGKPLKEKLFLSGSNWESSLRSSHTLCWGAGQSYTAESDGKLLIVTCFVDFIFFKIKFLLHFHYQFKAELISYVDYYSIKRKHSNSNASSQSNIPLIPVFSSYTYHYAIY